jgi:hypothetical protein
MKPAGEGQGRAEGLRPAEDETTEGRAVESRSWEPPCWPSDSWDDPIPTRRRAIGWRGLRGH